MKRLRLLGVGLGLAIAPFIWAGLFASLALIAEEEGSS